MDTDGGASDDDGDGGGVPPEAPAVLEPFAAREMQGLDVTGLLDVVAYGEMVLRFRAEDIAVGGRERGGTGSFGKRDIGVLDWVAWDTDVQKTVGGEWGAVAGWRGGSVAVWVDGKRFAVVPEDALTYVVTADAGMGDGEYWRYLDAAGLSGRDLGAGSDVEMEMADGESVEVVGAETDAEGQEGGLIGSVDSVDGGPDVPGGVPATVAGAIQAASDDLVPVYVRYAYVLLEWRLQNGTLIPDGVDAEALEAAVRLSGWTEVVKRVRCGKESCTTCPHGPYLYLARRHDDAVKWRYVGPVKRVGRTLTGDDSLPIGELSKKHRDNIEDAVRDLEELEPADVDDQSYRVSEMEDADGESDVVSSVLPDVVPSPRTGQTVTDGFDPGSCRPGDVLRFADDAPWYEGVVEGHVVTDSDEDGGVVVAVVTGTGSVSHVVVRAGDSGRVVQHFSPAELMYESSVKRNGLQTPPVEIAEEVTDTDEWGLNHPFHDAVREWFPSVYSHLFTARMEEWRVATDVLGVMGRSIRTGYAPHQSSGEQMDPLSVDVLTMQSESVTADVRPVDVDGVMVQLFRVAMALTDVSVEHAIGWYVLSDKPLNAILNAWCRGMDAGEITVEHQPLLCHKTNVSHPCAQVLVRQNRLLVDGRVIGETDVGAIGRPGTYRIPFDAVAVTDDSALSAPAHSWDDVAVGEVTRGLYEGGVPDGAETGEWEPVSRLREEVQDRVFGTGKQAAAVVDAAGIPIDDLRRWVNNTDGMGVQQSDTGGNRVAAISPGADVVADIDGEQVYGRVVENDTDEETLTVRHGKHVTAIPYVRVSETFSPSVEFRNVAVGDCITYSVGEFESYARVTGLHGSLYTVTAYDPVFDIDVQLSLPAITGRCNPSDGDILRDSDSVLEAVEGEGYVIAGDNGVPMVLHVDAVDAAFGEIVVSGEPIGRFSASSPGVISAEQVARLVPDSPAESVSVPGQWRGVPESMPADVQPGDEVVVWSHPHQTVFYGEVVEEDETGVVLVQTASGPVVELVQFSDSRVLFVADAAFQP